APADTIFVQGLTLDGVVIQGISNGQLQFQSSGGNSTSRDLSRVLRIHVEGETGLNAAEDAFVEGKFADAIDGYLKASRSSTHPWIQQYATGRLMESAAKTNRFDAAVTAYIQLLQFDPTIAAKNRPKIPESTSTYIDTAITQINQSLSGSNLQDSQRITLLQFQVDLYNAKKDARGADQAAAQLDEVLAKDPSNPLAAAAMVRRKLQVAGQAIDAKKYQAALDTIDSVRTKIVDPIQQADAMFFIAQAREGLAGANPDQSALEDVALAYMRVVANFKDVAGQPHAAASLLKTAQIEEQLHETDAAAKLYQQIAEQFSNDPAARPPRKISRRLIQSPDRTLRLFVFFCLTTHD
ncbi:MAG: hypothetical protein JO353_06040, partial [Phycisphaerae bacterium]|nr:hypothetical protein [Phycisphaerae bacterium]